MEEQIVNALVDIDDAIRRVGLVLAFEGLTICLTLILGVRARGWAAKRDR